MDEELIKALGDLLDDKLRPINEKLDEHTKILEEHTRILDKHSQLLDEHNLILRALEHSEEMNKDEYDKIVNDITHFMGDIEAIKKNLSTVEIVTASNYAYIAKLKAVK